MPSIPGQTRLGQGFPGGAAALSPGVSGQIPGIPTFEQVPRIQAPPPGMGLGANMNLAPALQSRPGATPQFGTDVTPSPKAYRLAEALTIIDRIRRGELDIWKARGLLSKFPVEIRRQLHSEIEASDIPNKKKLLQAVSTKETRGKDDRGTGLLDIPINLSKDIQDTVIGAPAGIAKLAVNLGRDVGAVASGEVPTNTYEAILKPVAESYRQTYGALNKPLGEIESEDFDEIRKHPLGPILDATSIVSGGIGAGARVASAGRAVKGVRANRDFEKIIEPESGLPNQFFRTPKPGDEDMIYLNKFSGFVNERTGEVVVGHSGSAHADVLEGWDTMDSKLGMTLDKAYENPGYEGWYPYTGIIDPETGRPAAANIHRGGDYADVGTKTPLTDRLGARVPDEADAPLQQAILAKASEKMWLDPPKVSKSEQAKSALRGFARPDHRGGLIDAYERSGGLAIGKRIEAFKAAARPTPEEVAEPEIAANIDLSPGERAIDKELAELAEYMEPDDLQGAREVMMERMAEAFTPAAQDLAKRLPPNAVISPMIARGEAMDRISLGEWTPTMSVTFPKEGHDFDVPGFTVFVRDGEYFVDDTIDITDGDFFKTKQDADEYTAAIQAVQGKDPDEEITLYRGMSAVEKRIWDRGEVIPPGKYFTSEKTSQYARDTMGEFPELHEFKVRRGDVVELSPGQFQLIRGARADKEGRIRSDDAPRNEGHVLPTPEELADDPSKLRFAVLHNETTGETLVGKPGEDHEALVNNLFPDEADRRRIRGEWNGPERLWEDGTGIFDPDTGEVAVVNIASEIGERAKRIEQTTLQRAREVYGSRKSEAEKPLRPKAGIVGSIKQYMDTGPKNLGDLKELDLSPQPQKPKLDLRKGLAAAFERQAAITHELELTNIMEDIVDVMDNPNLRLNRRTPKEVAKEVVADLRETRRAGRERPREMASNLPGFISAGSTGRVLSTGETALREASDLVRAGAIYLRPAYLPNNWAGNFFMNSIQQGVLAPVNLGKALVLDKHIGVRYTRAMDQAMGANAAEVITAGKGRGYIGSLTQPVAHVMGTLADQPFRRAALLHELRRKGYRKLSDVQGLLKRVENGDQKALRELADSARRAQEEIVKFGRMNDMERGVLRNLVFVYSWMRGAGRYAGRFPLQHPIQAAVMTHLGEEGKEWLDRELGGVPSFLMGAVPVGRDKDGNPILINPFSLNPLGTGIDIARAAAGTIEVMKDPNKFNKYAEQDVVGLLNPLIQAYMEAREGGNPPHSEALRAIAPLRLQHELRHPGSGGVYPTSRKEALGKFTFGTLFPRQADQAAIDRAVERQNVRDRAAIIPKQLEVYKRQTGQDVPPQLVEAYQIDLEAAEDLKKFQQDYAKDHGQQGFRNMPPINRLKAAIEWHRENGSIPYQELNRLEESLPGIKQDVILNDLANGLWGATGVGSIKRVWDELMRTAKGQQRTRERP